MNNRKSFKNIYLDNSATTIISEDVLKAMLPFLKTKFANPSSIHRKGREARSAIDSARETIALYLNSQIQEIIFTSGATESNNMALQGIASFYGSKKNHIITVACHTKASNCSYIFSS